MFKRDRELIDKLLDDSANHCLTAGDREYIVHALLKLDRLERTHEPVK
jgi:hypothetical protein